VRARLNAAEVSVEFSTEAQNLRHVIDTRLELAGASLPRRLGRHAYNCAVAVEHAAEWCGDPSRIALGGDSSGANLAAVTANRLCGQGEAHTLRALMLLYPVTYHPSGGHSSYTENASGYRHGANLMHWFWQQYAPDVSPTDPNVPPLRLQEVPSLPPTLMATVEYEALRDEGIAYAEKLRAAGTAVTHLHAPDMAITFPRLQTQ
jgi:acetyl esterase